MTQKTLMGTARPGRRRGFSLVETLILIVVVNIAFVALFESMTMSMRARSVSEEDLDARLAAESWFETLGSEGKSTLALTDAEIFGKVGSTLGWIRKGNDYYKHGLSLTPSRGALENGVYPVSLKIIRLEDKRGRTYTGCISSYEERNGLLIEE